MGNSQNLNNPHVVEWINNVWCVHIMKCYPILKGNEWAIHATFWINLKRLSWVLKNPISEIYIFVLVHPIELGWTLLPAKFGLDTKTSNGIKSVIKSLLLIETGFKGDQRRLLSRSKCGLRKEKNGCLSLGIWGRVSAHKKDGVCLVWISYWRWQRDHLSFITGLPKCRVRGEMGGIWNLLSASYHKCS